MKRTYKYSATDLFNEFNSFIQANKFKIEMSSTKFGIDIKNYEGVESKKQKQYDFIL